jgi:hypothetical protein
MSSMAITQPAAMPINQLAPAQLERLRLAPRSTVGHRAWQDEPEHLLDRTTHLSSWVSWILAIRRAAVPKPIGDERVHVVRQARKRAYSSRTGEVSKANQQRDTILDARRGVPVLAEPGNVLFDRGREPRSSNPIDRFGPDEVPLQHDNLIAARGGHNSVGLNGRTNCAPHSPHIYNGFVGELFRRHISGDATEP